MVCAVCLWRSFRFFLLDEEVLPTADGRYSDHIQLPRCCKEAETDVPQAKLKVLRKRQSFWTFLKYSEH